MTTRILIGDCRERLAELPAALRSKPRSFVVASPLTNGGLCDPAQ